MSELGPEGGQVSRYRRNPEHSGARFGGLDAGAASLEEYMPIPRSRESISSHNPDWLMLEIVEFRLLFAILRMNAQSRPKVLSCTKELSRMLPTLLLSCEAPLA